MEVPLGVGFRVDPKDAVPVWRQIEAGLTRLVANGALAPGTAVRSVRDLARELGVNPMTVAKAYQRLAEAGVLEARTGKGTFVRSRPAPRQADARALRERADALVTAAAALGIVEDDVVAEVRGAFSRLRREARDRGASA